MDFLRGVDAALAGDGPFDWAAAARAAKADTEPGSAEPADEARAAYATALREFREPVGAVLGVEDALPESLSVLDRHHWIDAQLAACRRVTVPDREASSPLVEALTAAVGTGRLGTAVSAVAGSSLGRYDRHFPLAFADERADVVHVVHPNVERMAAAVDADPTRVRQWAVAHELVHAAALEAAPWVLAYLGDRVRGLVDRLQRDGGVPGALGEAPEVAELQAALVVLEGHATLAFARAFDGGFAALHREVDAVRWRRTGMPDLVGDLLGIDPEPALYDRGRQFLIAVVDERGIEAGDAVLSGPDALPALAELERPQRWLDRVDP